MFLGRTTDDPTNVRVFLEESIEQVIKNLNDGLPINYFNVKTDTVATVLQPITLNPAVRIASRGTEIAEAIVAGQVFGSVEVFKKS